MRVSFIVPAFNEAATIEEVLRRVYELDLDKQVIVVDDGSTDGIEEILARWEGGGEGGSPSASRTAARERPSARPFRTSTATWPLSVLIPQLAAEVRGLCASVHRE